MPNVLPDEQVVTPTEKKLELSQAELDQLIETRLERERTKLGAQVASLEADLDNVRREARLRLAKAEGRSADTVSQRLDHEASQQEKDNIERGRLAMTFGNTPGASLRAQRWFKEDPKSYREGRERYRILCGGRPAPVAVPKIKNAFEK